MTNGRLDAQREHAERTAIRPLVARLVELGVIDDPGEYEVEWLDCAGPCGPDQPLSTQD